MNEIDFLPREYRKKNFERNDQRRQAMIVGVLFLAIGISYTWQRTANARLANRLEQAHLQHQVTLDQAEELRQLEVQLQDLRADAQAIAYLSHPWPQTQVVGAVVERLPDSITLTQLRVMRTPKAPVQRRREEEKPQGRTALARDESQLRERYDGVPFELVISGTTRDHVRLHAFLLELDKHPLVDRAELTSLDGASESVGEYEFTVTCTLAEGYGQPGGPIEPSVASQSSR